MTWIGTTDHDEEREIKRLGGECKESWVAVSEWDLASWNKFCFTSGLHSALFFLCGVLNFLCSGLARGLWVILEDPVTVGRQMVFDRTRE
jgi:hypothetical protein